MLKYGGTLYLKLPVSSQLDSSSLHSVQTVWLLPVTLLVSWDSLCFLILCLCQQFLLLSCRPQASHLNRLHEIAGVDEGMNRPPACEDGTVCEDEGFSRGDGWLLVALVEQGLAVLPAWGGAGGLFWWWGPSNGRCLMTGGVIHWTRNSCLSWLWKRNVLAWWQRSCPCNIGGWSKVNWHCRSVSQNPTTNGRWKVQAQRMANQWCEGKSWK